MCRNTLLTLCILGIAAGRSLCDEAVIAKRVTELGGQVTFDREQFGMPIVGLDFFGSMRITDTEIAVLSKLVHLKKLSLLGTRVTDAGLKELRVHQGLEELNLGMISTTDVGLRAISSALLAKHVVNESSLGGLRFRE